ncbi:twin-arginine translocation signal domain-containing protein [Bradyrhizobium sp.]|uniref:twin-arginine translocation signal domain-containing protein n=1 Tax=Bradyrhizobium sp. TaxID=376 RepID=UPI0025B9EC21|nr:twin-arginine translocation signal domain-containing protein [Bradyrhizobium sp.]
MERRHFLKLVFGFAAGGVALAASAQAAPLMPVPLADDADRLPNPDAQPAVTTGDEVESLTPEEVRGGRGRGRGGGRGRGWGRGRHRGWGRRHYGWRRRHYGWRRRYWGRRRRRYWRRRYW